MNHSCPVENPDEEAENTLFEGAIGFVMASGDMGSWELEVHVHNHVSDKEGEITFDITVNEPDLPMMKSFTGSNSVKYFVSYYFPSKPKVGMNEIHIMVNKKEDMMTWPAVLDMDIAMEPEMVSMGHGSPNNLNPSITNSGHYVGQVNFTMTGDWRINLDLELDDEPVGELYFDMIVE
jgi:hypothetical protein